MLYSSKSVLYVDDTVEQRYAMRRILEGAGYRVIEASTGGEALSLLAPEIVAVILDVKLPDMSGYDVCRKIKADDVGSGLPIIQVSASFAEPSLRAEALSGGADAYIAQPVHPQELLNLLRATVQAHRADRMLRLLASVGLRIGGSLDLEETVRSARESVVPVFCDRCRLCLTHHEDLHREPMDEMLLEVAGLSQELGSAQVANLKTLNCSVIAAPLATSTLSLGTILFILDGTHRRYTASDIPLAQDLAARIALALQNARLYTEQQAAQAALIQSEKIAAAGRLSAAIAHEINNPLEAVVNLVYLIETSAASESSVRKYAQDALSELSRIAHITRQTLGFYRELVGPQEFDLSESIHETLVLLSRRIRTQSIHVHEQLTPGLRIRAVKGEIRQVISNLILNALDSMEQGGALTLETSQAPDDFVVARITDTGRGIPPEHAARIFEPFFTTKNGTGTGLGLWVSQQIVHKHGGEIRVRSESAGSVTGTTMEVLLRRGPMLP